MKGGKKSNHDVAQETPLQALLLADSCTKPFLPITLERPKILFPVANAPMIEYALECLVISNVKEIFIFCIDHYKEIKRYMKTESRIAKHVKVHCITSTACLTAGDALREIDQQQLIHSDPFILMTADTITNINLQKAIQAHKKRKKRDSQCIMTSIFKEIPANIQLHNVNRSTNIRSLQDELVVAMNRKTYQLILYENDDSRSCTSISTEFLKEHSAISFHIDLMDCGIDICSPQVLLKFAENFDYQHVRDDFLHNEVQNYEVGSRFYVHLDDTGFAARIQDPRTYSGVSHAVLQRWLFPMVPDNNYLTVQPSRYTYHRGMIYKDEDVSLSRTCCIERECIIGKSSSFGDDTIVRRSSIGSNCRIGNNVRIENSFLWNNVGIGDNVTIRNSILCDGVIVGNEAIIDDGCIISFNVAIEKGMRIQPYTKITTCKKVEEEDAFGPSDDRVAETCGDFEECVEQQSDIAGHVGRIWTIEEDELDVYSSSSSEDEDAANEVGITHDDRATRQLMKLKSMMIGAQDVVETRARRWDDLQVYSSDEEEGALEYEPQSKKTHVPFEQMLRELVITGDQAGHDTNDLFLEIKSCKFAQNRTFSDVIQAIISALIDLSTDTTQDVAVLLQRVREKLVKWSSVLERCLVADIEQISLIHVLESYCSDKSHIIWRPLFRFLLQIVYDLEMVTEEVILDWHASRVKISKDLDPASDKPLALEPSVLVFIEWLQEEEEDEDSEADA